MVTGEFKQTEVIFPLEVGSSAKEEIIVEIKENNTSITEKDSEIKPKEIRFSRLKKALRKRSISIL